MHSNQNFHPPEDSLAAASKAWHSVTVPHSHCAPGYLPSWLENICPHNHLHENAHSSFIPNHEKLKATEMAFNGLVDNKLWGIHAVRSALSDHTKTWINLLSACSKWKTPVCKGWCCIISFLWRDGKVKTIEKINRSVVGRVEVEGDGGRSNR